MHEMGVEVNTMKVGNDNLFQSAIFSNAISTLLNCRIEVIETTGSTGAAFASGLVTGGIDSLDNIADSLKVVRVYTPQTELKEQYEVAYGAWAAVLGQALGG